MPSYIGHSVCAKELLKKLKLSDVNKTKFMIGNLIPDIKQVDIDYTLDEFVNKKNIQRSKRITHFRKETDFILEYPHCRLFLEKYEKEVKRHIETLAYFFHLYTDYYYFKFYLPSVITFLDYDCVPTDVRNGFYFVKINKNDQVVKAKAFFSKLSKKSLYKEYARSNSYLIKKFNLDLDTDYYREYIAKKGFNCYVEEVNLNKIYDVFDRIDKVYDRMKEEELFIFEENKLDSFVKEVVKTFMKEYGYLLTKYK